MKRRSLVSAWIVAALLFTPGVAPAQLGGMSLPTGGFSKDALLKQAKDILGELTSMKSSGKLAAPQAKQVDDLLPKAQALNDELEKPQVDAARLPQLSSNVNDLQKQLGVLRGFMK